MREYLEKCVNSVLNQTYTNLEVILVDDGSNDGSEELCDYYKEMDPRVKVIHQSNQGVVSARNRGIDNATGEYIAFVDADDWLDECMYEKLIKHIHESDMIATGYYKVYDEEKELYKYLDLIPSGRYSGKMGMEYVWRNMIYMEDGKKSGISSFLWNKLFKMELIKMFYKELNEKIRYSEDAVFLYNYLLRCKTIIVLNEAYCYHRIRRGSAVFSEDRYFLYNVNDFYLSLLEVFSAHYLKGVLITKLEKRIVEMIKDGLNYKMGFKIQTSNLYQLPYKEELDGKRIALYGAGRVGQAYYKQLQNSLHVTIKLWVDKNYDEIVLSDAKVVAVENLRECEFDYLILAVESELLANTIKEELIVQNICAEEKILWKTPVI